MEGLDFETITALLACAGEATLAWSMMCLGLLEKSFYDELGFPVPSVARDPLHVANVKLGDFPRRLIYDDLFGWLWYNADGPEEESSNDPA